MKAFIYTVSLILSVLVGTFAWINFAEGLSVKGPDVATLCAVMLAFTCTFLLSYVMVLLVDRSELATKLKEDKATLSALTSAIRDATDIIQTLTNHSTTHFGSSHAVVEKGRSALLKLKEAS